MRYDLSIESMEWSYSRLTAFEDCPYMWLMRYILRDEYSIVPQFKFFAQYGSLMHSILQQYLTGVLPQKSLVAYYVSHFISDIYGETPIPQNLSGLSGAGTAVSQNTVVPCPEDTQGRG